MRTKPSTATRAGRRVPAMAMATPRPFVGDLTMATVKPAVCTKLSTCPAGLSYTRQAAGPEGHYQDSTDDRSSRSTLVVPGIRAFADRTI